MSPRICAGDIGPKSLNGPEDLILPCRDVADVPPAFDAMIFEPQEPRTSTGPMLGALTVVEQEGPLGAQAGPADLQYDGVTPVGSGTDADDDAVATVQEVLEAVICAPMQTPIIRGAPEIATCQDTGIHWLAAAQPPPRRQAEGG